MDCVKLSGTHWTPPEDDRLRRLWAEGKGDVECAQALGRSKRSVQARRDMLGLTSRLLDGYTIYQVARLFGVYDAVAYGWADAGYLRSQKVNSGAALVTRVVTYDDLLAFIADEAYWHEWDIEPLTDPDLRAWAQECRKGVRFVTAKEAARFLHLSTNMVWYHIGRGTIPAKRRGCGAWFIPWEWLEAHPELPRKSPRGKRLFTEDETAYLRENRPMATVAELARVLHREATTVRSYCAKLGLVGPSVDPRERNYQRRGPYLTPADKAFLREWAEFQPPGQLAAAVGCEVGLVEQTLRGLRLASCTEPTPGDFEWALRRVLHEHAEHVQCPAFGGLVVDLATNKITVHGKAVELRPRALDVLRILVEHADGVLSTDELFLAVWGTARSADPKGLVREAVRTVRRAIEDDPCQPRFLVTTPLGYRFERTALAELNLLAQPAQASA